VKRTQIYLRSEQWQKLQIESEREHKSVAELIRQAIDKIYLAKRKPNFEEALDAVTGIWADRTDIGSTEEYVRSLRCGTRLKRFGLNRE